MGIPPGGDMTDQEQNDIKRRLGLARLILKYLRPEAPAELLATLQGEVNHLEARLSGHTLDEHTAPRAAAQPRTIEVVSAELEEVVNELHFAGSPLPAERQATLAAAKRALGDELHQLTLAQWERGARDRKIADIPF